MSGLAQRADRVLVLRRAVLDRRLLPRRRDSPRLAVRDVRKPGGREHEAGEADAADAGNDAGSAYEQEDGRSESQMTVSVVLSVPNA